VSREEKDMEIRNLKTFLKVADLKNFTRAGVELGYSQTNVSAQIRQLEQGLGAPLFNRIGRHVTLTQYGEELLPYARRIVTAATEMDSFLKSDDSLGGTVRLGMAESLFDLAGEETVRAYHRRFPRVKLELTVDATAALEDGIRHGTLDTACLIDDPLPAPEWVCRYSREVPIVLAANPANALCTCREVLPEDLSGQEFVLMENSAAYSVRFLRIAAGLGLTPKVFLTLQSAKAACGLVAREDVLSVLPLYSVRQAAEEGAVCILSAPSLAQSQWVQTVMHPDRAAAPQVEGLIRELETALDRAAAGPAGSFGVKRAQPEKE
jgi:DNA-binding transcriptional LysR family regulator